MSREVERDVTDLLLAWREGDKAALAELMPIVYRRLKRLAIGLLREERGSHTLQPTALVHEAYLRLVELERLSWRDRAHFYAMSTTLMRRILVDHARQLDSAKRGKEMPRVSIDEARDTTAGKPAEIAALDEALSELAEKDGQLARIVELRYFGGLNREEIAEVLDTSSASVTRKWRKARAWLLRYLSQNEGMR